MSDPLSKIVTANALTSGDVVYLTARGDWSPEIVEADFMTDAAEAAARLSEVQCQSQLVIGPYIADVTITANGPVPVTRREAMRAAGPSITYGPESASGATAIAAE
ncbi:DUF2849 domain-containing protein [Aquicoccus sp.]|uniref:DUF2849 domain-containing protein n=1 Tax=Aquicoccus sp. TaxID=2055851 RepID=UPI0035669512